MSLHNISSSLRNQNTVSPHNVESTCVKTTLCIRDIPYVEDAMAYFGRDRTERGLLAGEKVMIVTVSSRTYSWCSIPEGIACLMSSWGVINPTPVTAGFYIMPFWKKVHFVVNTQYIPMDVPVQKCPTADNIFIQIDTLALIKVVDPYKFAINIGPSKLQDVLVAFLEESIRSVARAVTYAEAYDIRGHELTGMVRALNEKTEQFGVVCHSVTIQDIFLPGGLVQTLSRESSYASLLKAQARQTDFTLLKISNEEKRKDCDLQRKNERLAYDAVMQQKIAMIRKESEEIQGLTSLKLVEVNSEMETESFQIGLKASHQVNVFTGQKERDFKVTLAKGTQTSTNITWKMLTYERVKKAQTQKLVTEQKVQAIKIKAQAENDVKEKMKLKRQDTINRRKLLVLTQLSNNKDIVISGSSKYSETAQLMASSDVKLTIPITQSVENTE
jgi:regulator of protease activity HflC (stomatin/prohibitin superfamily)